MALQSAAETTLVTLISGNSQNSVSIQTSKNNLHVPLRVEKLSRNSLCINSHPRRANQMYNIFFCKTSFRHGSPHSLQSSMVGRDRNLFSDSYLHSNWSKFRIRKISSMSISNDEKNYGKGLNLPEGWDPSLEIQVPTEQRPVNELVALKGDGLYNWAQLLPSQFYARIAALWLIFFVSLGGPIASATYEPLQEPIAFVLAGSLGSLIPVAIIVLRIYLGWSYVGDRLLSAVIPYEESGWYDGQLWVKPPEILARDRLIGTYEVKPIMSRLKQTLIGVASVLVVSIAGLVTTTPIQNPEDEIIYIPRSLSATSEQSNSQVSFRVRDLINPPIEIIDDDDLAAAAAAAAKGRPVYCQDRYYRALAGGQYCKSSDLKL